MFLDPRYQHYPRQRSNVGAMHGRRRVGQIDIAAARRRAGEPPGEGYVYVPPGPTDEFGSWVRPNPGMGARSARDQRETERRIRESRNRSGGGMSYPSPPRNGNGMGAGGMGSGNGNGNGNGNGMAGPPMPPPGPPMPPPGPPMPPPGPPMPPPGPPMPPPEPPMAPPMPPYDYGSCGPSCSPLGTVSQNCGKFRTYPLSFRALIPAGQTQDIQVSPQKCFKGSKLSISGTNANQFLIIDLKVGTASQSVAGGGIPGELFIAGADENLLDLDWANPGILITMQVQNLDTVNAQQFNAALIGVTYETSSQ